ncbi:Ig-like domain-containing protein [Luteolibacter luteus]|uniref:Tandem-95 repeat protein n=1 Tax=Luteolibacter luteus TaxID=2728835 RepID=A0A858RQR0_9BACT|nr:Ig-like domain-containing protein [Luteolibacter luteus]QJE98981.1 tandem-95 repeat protein [Luteolibacter luteus]
MCSTSGTLAATAGSVTLGWLANPEANIQRYELQWGTASGSRPNTVDAGKNLTASIGGLNPGTTYYFAVIARNSFGQPSQPSSEVAFTMPGTPNTAPEALSTGLTLEEEGQQDLTLSASDAESDALTYAIVSSPSKGTLLGSPPNLTYRAGLNQSGSDSFSFRVSDGVLESAVATVSVIITPVNDPPVASGKSVTTNEDSSVVIALGGTDPDGDALTYTILSPPALGTLSGSGANRTYQPAANASGNDSFTYTVSDGSFESEPATVMITVNPVNDTPVANAGTASTAEDTPVAITLGGSDAEGSTLSYLTAAPANGIISGTPPNLTYTPKANHNGSDTFTFRVNDGALTSTPATVTISISPVNDQPVAQAKTVKTVRDNAVAVTLAGSDVDGDALSYQVVTQPASGTLSGTPPNLSYKATAGFTGADRFTYRVHDGVLPSAEAAVSIEVASNTPPVASARTVTTNEDTEVAVLLAGTDGDGDVLSYSIVSSPGKGVLTGSGANLVYKPNANVNGSDSFTFRVNDGREFSAAATVALSITAVNDAPLANGRSATTLEDTPVSIVLSGSDIESSNLSYAIVTQPANGTLAGNAPNLTYTPKLNYNGGDSFTFRVNDGSANSTPATVNITVNPVNDAPAANPKSISTPRNTAVAVVLTGGDAEGSPLTFTVMSSPVNGTLSGTPPNLTYTPKNDFAGSDSFTFRVNDGSANSPNATVSIGVANTNRPPQAHGKAVTTMMSKAVSVQLAGTDADANPLSYRIVNAPANGTLTGTPPNVVYKPKTRWSGNDQFTYVVNDGSLDSAAATVSVKVKKKNLKPVGQPQSMVVNQNGSGSTTLAGSDADGDALSFSIVTKPVHGTLTLALPGVTYTPEPGYKGKDRFTFVVNDGTAKSLPTAIEINVVNPNNQVPIPADREYTTSWKTAVPVPISATDPDGDKLTYVVVDKPSAGKLTGKVPNLVYKAPKNFTGTVRFSFKSSDGTALSGLGWITITVTNPPAANARSLADGKDGKAVSGAQALEPDLLPVLSVHADPARKGGLLLQASGTPGRSYMLESSSRNVVAWQPVQAVTLGEDGTAKVALMAPEESGYYRLSDP